MAYPALLANENIPAPAVRVLREAGVSVSAVSEIMRSATDREVLAHAHANGLWVLTLDRDYGELVFARQVRPPPAIIYLRLAPMLPADVGRAVLPLLDNASFILGHLVVLQGQSVRRRAMPADTSAGP